MKTSSTTFFITAIIFGAIAIVLGLISEYRLGNAVGVPNQYLHADAAIYACGFISAACFITTGLIAIKQK
jgi:hypothetical protein